MTERDWGWFVFILEIDEKPLRVFFLVEIE